MNHRIAILSDIHGDTTALKAVIADARALGATEYWLLGDILLSGPGREDLFELLDAIPITAAVRGNWDDCVLEALDGEYGLEDPQEIQLLRLTQYLMEGLDPKRIDWLRSLPLVEKKEVNGIRFSLSHNLPEKNYGGDLRPANATENFDQLLDDQTDMAMSTNSCFAMAVRANRSSIQELLVCLILTGNQFKTTGPVCSDRCRRRWDDQPAIS